MPNDLLFTILSAGYLTVVLGITAFVDLRHLIIPDRANIANLGGALVFSCLQQSGTLASAAVGGLIGASAFMLLAAAFKRMRGYDGLGMGDAKFMAGAGAWVGWQGLAPLVFLASLTALLYIAMRAALGRGFNARTKVPFAPFLCVATLTTWSLQAGGIAPWMI